jgi:acetylornithine deacetylase/succinyl-diaminopimelate desuccinylase-like protein
MLDLRLYRVAFVPVLLALLVAAFSLQDRPRAIGTTLTPDAFDTIRAQQTLDDLAHRFPDRRPGSVGDERLASDIATTLRATVPGTVEEHRYRGETIDGTRDLVDVVATRPGAPGPGIVVVAHRDAAARGSKAELSATAALLELARVAADGRLRRTITFISTSGGSGGYAGAREEAQRLDGRADAVLVLGDVASEPGRRPFVVSFSDGPGQTPLQLRRTVEAAVHREVGTDAGAPRAFTQWARIAVPVTISEQGPFLRAGQPAVLLSASGERPPAPNATLRAERMAGFGRAGLRVLYALDNFRDLAQPPRDDLVIRGKVLPSWAVRLLVGTLLLPPLLVGIDAFARLRRRHEGFTAWAVWSLSAGVPFLVACLFAVLLAAVGLIGVAPPAPIPPGALHLGAGPVIAAVAILMVFALGWLVLRPALLHAAGVRAKPDTPGAAIAVAMTAGAVVVGLWFGNPYAAGLAVPALHLWLLVNAHETRLPRPAALALVVLAMLPPVLVGIIDARAFGLDLPHFGWFWTLLVAGGHVPIGSWVLWSLLWGCAVAATLVAARRRPEDEGPDEVTVRGPVSYAGPGSLGGTESALRR